MRYRDRVRAVFYALVLNNETHGRKGTRGESRARRVHVESERERHRHLAGDLEIQKEGFIQYKKEHRDETGIRFLDDPGMVRHTHLRFS